MLRKILRVIGKTLKFIFFLTIFGLALLMLGMIGKSFLVSDDVGSQVSSWECDKECYDTLGLEGKIEFTDDLKIKIERGYIICEYFTPMGHQSESFWTSGREVELLPEGWDNLVLGVWRPDGNRKLFGLQIKDAEAKFQTTCHARHPEWDDSGENDWEKQVILLNNE